MTGPLFDRVALEHGCGFFDLVAFQGGSLSMVQWAANDPAYASQDHIHYTRLGYQRLGEVLLSALLEGASASGEPESGTPESTASLEPVDGGAPVEPVELDVTGDALAR